MARDYIPDSAENFLSWAKTLRDSISTLTLPSPLRHPQAGPARPPGQAHRPTQKVTDLRTQLTGAETALGNARTRELPELRNDLGDLKHLEGFPAGVAEELGIVTQPPFPATTP